MRATPYFWTFEKNIPHHESQRRELITPRWPSLLILLSQKYKCFAPGRWKSSTAYVFFSDNNTTLYWLIMGSKSYIRSWEVIKPAARSPWMLIKFTCILLSCGATERRDQGRRRRGRTTVRLHRRCCSRAGVMALIHGKRVTKRTVQSLFGAGVGNILGSEFYTELQNAFPVMPAVFPNTDIGANS